MQASNNNEVIEDLKPKRRGRPKTNSLDKKEYQKEYYKKNKDSLLEQKKEYYNQHKDEILEHQKEYYSEHKDDILNYQKQYIQTLKENEPDRYNSIRERTNELSREIHKKERALFKLFLQWYEKGEMTLPDTHREIIKELII